MAHFKGADIEIEGIDELINAFAKLPDEAMKYALAASNEAGQIVLYKAREKVSKRTGNLASKLTLKKAKKSTKYPLRVFSSVTSSKGAGYMVPLELGHKLVMHGKTVGAVKERPFLRPAADESKDEVVNIFVNAMNKALDEMGGKK